ncbi:phosphoribosylaminoimidazolesuccinocarboxamide synthase [Nocardia huaxiensis]|uniref:Phosphoribosylaminoimidazole-succinocarboxamide synthase n=1 Tax=Nocardia huaxiensis TaxID=2755382 RepID=A0A7D6ZWE0_9NOCA|nr:phosphoribosylaminoimidazolesuccinocarboxamide synthase [Nocardia huaxiensis]
MPRSHPVQGRRAPSVGWWLRESRVDTGGSQLKHIHAGKVRDLYEDGDSLILVASDRVSVYDVVLPTPIPDKGAMLTQLSNWWFEFFSDVPNHIISTTDVPAEFAGRGVRVKPLQMVKVECIARGYLTGSGLKEYQATGTVSGIALPPGLRDGDKLPEPIFTPTTKADEGHDEPISFADVVNQEGKEVAEQLRDLTLGVYARGAEHAAARGVIIADTKIELGWDGDVLTLGDEVLTSDSSRFWPADDYEPGRPQKSFDKQYVRDWSTSTGWNKEYPGPEIPAEVVEVTRQKYMQAYELITGKSWA